MTKKTMGIMALLFVAFIAANAECETGNDYYQRGVETLNQGMNNNNSMSIESSIPLFDAAIENLSDDRQRASAYSKRAVAHGMVGKIDLAIEDWTASLALYENLFARKMRGCMYAATRDAEKAISDFARVCASDPKSDACDWMDAIHDGKIDTVCKP